MKTLYLAGRLFNAAERLHNLFLEKYLKALGYDVILPQREALKHFDGTRFNTDTLREECRELCSDPHICYVGCIDGPDADSGTAVEYGIAITVHGQAIVYRTDFRTAKEKEIGINAMFELRGTKLVLKPCLFTEMDQVNAYYLDLANAIDCAIESLKLTAWS